MLFIKRLKRKERTEFLEDNRQEKLLFKYKNRVVRIKEKSSINDD